MLHDKIQNIKLKNKIDMSMYVLPFILKSELMESVLCVLVFSLIRITILLPQASLFIRIL